MFKVNILYFWDKVLVRKVKPGLEWKSLSMRTFLEKKIYFLVGVLVSFRRNYYFTTRKRTLI